MDNNANESFQATTKTQQTIAAYFNDIRYMYYGSSYKVHESEKNAVNLNKCQLSYSAPAPFQCTQKIFQSVLDLLSLHNSLSFSNPSLCFITHMCFSVMACLEMSKIPVPTERPPIGDLIFLSSEHKLAIIWSKIDMIAYHWFHFPLYELYLQKYILLA